MGDETEGALIVYGKPGDFNFQSPEMTKPSVRYSFMRVAVLWAMSRILGAPSTRASSNDSLLTWTSLVAASRQTARVGRFTMHASRQGSRSDAQFFDAQPNLVQLFSSVDPHRIGAPLRTASGFGPCVDFRDGSRRLQFPLKFPTEQ
jgi:hypothetical protein